MSAVLLIVTGLVVTLLLYLKRVKDRDFWKKVATIKGVPALPIIGNVHRLGSEPHGMFYNILKIWEETGYSTFRLHLGPDINVMLTTPECTEAMLKHTSQIHKAKEYGFLTKWLGDGLLLSTGAKWKRQRKVITPTFHFKILETYVDIFNQHSTKLIKRLEKKEGDVIDIYPLIARCSLDIICETAMGINVNAQDDCESEYVSAVNEICKILIRRMFSALKRTEWIFNLTSDGREQAKCVKVLHDLSNKVIRKRREEMKDEIKAAFSSSSTDLSERLGNEGKKVRPFLDLLLLSQLSDGSPLDDTTIRDEVDTFIFEGHDTTTSGISFALYTLSRHPDVQKLAYLEQVDILGDDLSVNPTHADLQEMKYLEKVIKETLRLYPSVPMIGRGITEDMPLPDGSILPAGVTATTFIFALHRHPKYYKNPNDFNPDRFDEEFTKENPFLYVPFSAGLRNCIGQKFAMLELKSTLSKILRRFELKSAGPEYEVKLAGDITLKSINGVHVVLTKRKQ